MVTILHAPLPMTHCGKTSFCSWQLCCMRVISVVVLRRCGSGRVPTGSHLLTQLWHSASPPACRRSYAPSLATSCPHRCGCTRTLLVFRILLAPASLERWSGLAMLRCSSPSPSSRQPWLCTGPPPGLRLYHSLLDSAMACETRNVPDNDVLACITRPSNDALYAWHSEILCGTPPHVVLINAVDVCVPSSPHASLWCLPRDN